MLNLVILLGTRNFWANYHYTQHIIVSNIYHYTQYHSILYTKAMVLINGLGLVVLRQMGVSGGGNPNRT